jgi:hypothetical protein
LLLSDGSGSRPGRLDCLLGPGAVPPAKHLRTGARLELLVDVEEVADLGPQMAGTSSSSLTPAILGSRATTESTLPSRPSSSYITNMPTGRTVTPAPGNAGSSSQTSASSGSPSTASVPGMNP